MHQESGSVFLFFIIAHAADIEESQLIGVLIRSDNTNEIAKHALLQVLLGEVLEITLREWDLRGDREALLTFGDLDRVTEIPLLAIDFDVIVQELLKTRNIKDTVRGWS